MRLIPLAALLITVPMLAGCLGGEARSEWAFDATQVDSLAKQGRNGSGVMVAVLDTGINVGHPSLDHLVDGDESDGELVDFHDYLDGNDGVENAYDPDGHGSHVAGILAARGSSTSDKLVYGGVDLKGASPGIRLLVARVCDTDSCDTTAIPQAVDWAVASGADVISLSLGGQSGLPPALEGLVADALRQAIDAAIDSGVVVVASAGNEGRRCPEDTPGTEAADVSSPANIEGVIAVGAVDKDGRVWCGSSRGMDDGGNECRSTPLPIPGLPALGRCDPHRKPELVAPGVEILSAWTGDSYVRATGTSQATPFVSAAVALILQGQPDLQDRDDVYAVKQALVASAKPVVGQETPHDEAAGYGLLQADAALAAYS